MFTDQAKLYLVKDYNTVKKLVMCVLSVGPYMTGQSYVRPEQETNHIVNKL
jgi:hypothetical protein